MHNSVTNLTHIHPIIYIQPSHTNVQTPYTHKRTDTIHTQTYKHHTHTNVHTPYTRKRTDTIHTQTYRHHTRTNILILCDTYVVHASDMISFLKLYYIHILAIGYRYNSTLIGLKSHMT